MFYASVAKNARDFTPVVVDFMIESVKPPAFIFSLFFMTKKTKPAHSGVRDITSRETIIQSKFV